MLQYLHWFTHCLLTVTELFKGNSIINCKMWDIEDPKKHEYDAVPSTDLHIAFWLLLSYLRKILFLVAKCETLSTPRIMSMMKFYRAHTSNTLVTLNTEMVFFDILCLRIMGIHTTMHIWIIFLLFYFLNLGYFPDFSIESPVSQKPTPYVMWELTIEGQSSGF